MHPDRYHMYGAADTNVHIYQNDSRKMGEQKLALFMYSTKGYLANIQEELPKLYMCSKNDGYQLSQLASITQKREKLFTLMFMHFTNTTTGQESHVWLIK